jgi:hypothetical protein
MSWRTSIISSEPKAPQYEGDFSIRASPIDDAKKYGIQKQFYGTKNFLSWQMMQNRALEIFCHSTSCKTGALKLPIMVIFQTL